MSGRQALLQTVETNGWRLNNEFLDDLLQDRPNLNSNDLIKIALNTDLKVSGKKCISDGVMIGKCDNFDGPCVVQVVKIKNIAAPKDNENSMSAPPFYKVTLTDGVANCNALVMNEISNFNLDTAPGVKLLLKGSIKVKQSSLLLNNQVCQVLGGMVEHLYNKWKTTKELANYVRIGGDSSAAPPWVPFGTQQTNKVDTTKKTLKQTETSLEDETSEFSQQRQAALAEAMQEKLKINKTFIHQNVDKTIPIATSTSNETRQHSASTTTTTTTAATNPTKKGGRFRRNNDEDDEGDFKDSAKPTSTTLFDFISKNNKKLQIKESTGDSNADATQLKSTKKSITDNTSDNIESTTINKQSSNLNNNYNRRNNRGDYDYNSNNINNKERKSNLPPRFQNKIQNEERQYVNYTNNNNNNNQDRRTSGVSNNNQDRIQKSYNNNNNNNQYYEESSSSSPPPPPTITTANKINDTDNYNQNRKSYNSNSNNKNNKYNRDYSNNEGNNNSNYYYPTRTYHNSNYNNNNNNSNNQKQMQQYYIASSPTVPQQQQQSTPQVQPQTFVPANVLYFDSQSGHPQQFPTAAYYNGQIAATPMYPYSANPYEPTNGFYCAPLPIQIPISNAAIATATPAQIITTVATHVIPPPSLPLTSQTVEQQQTNTNDNNTPQNGNQTNKNNSQISWKKGDECLAIYYSDKKYYPAIIKSIKNNKAYVEYIGYDDSDEVYLNDIKSHDSSRPSASGGQSVRVNQK